MCTECMHVGVAKDNTKGVGFKGHDDTWLAHQDDFQNVLAALNVEHGEAGKNMDEDEKKATLSEISKKSKRRVHYQKFVKGKDSSNYSADDLGCILGTKSDKLKNKSEPSSPQVEPEEEDVKDSNKNFVQSSVTGADYFAQKMAAPKAKGKFTDVPAWTEAKPNPRNLGLGAEKVETKVATEKKVEEKLESMDTVHVETEHVEVKKKKKSKKKKETEEGVEVDEEKEIACEESAKIKKKKHKKDRQERLDFDTSDNDVDKQVEVEEEVVTKKKKSKKSKKDALQVNFEESSPEEAEVAKKKKAKKSKKEKVADEEPEVEEDSGCENEESKNKKTKKGKKEKTKEKKLTYSDEEKENVRKNKRKADSEESQDDVEVPKKKKSKKNKSTPSAPTENALVDNSSKIPGFQGSNLLSIAGYGEENK